MTIHVVELPDGRSIRLLPYSIVVSVDTTRGRRKLHRFYAEFDADTGAHHSPWILSTPPTHKQAAEDARRIGSDDIADWPIPTRGPRRQIGVELHEEIQSVRSITLSEGAAVPTSTLSLILDALTHHGRHEVDLDDIKVVVSQLSTTINRYLALNDDARSQIRAALYEQVFERCATL